jgi:hypothetical protein
MLSTGRLAIWRSPTNTEMNTGIWKTTKTLRWTPASEEEKKKKRKENIALGTWEKKTKQNKNTKTMKKELHVHVQWNLWIASLRIEDILWNKDTLPGPKLLFSMQIDLWNEDTFELGTPLARPKGVLISQVSLYLHYRWRLLWKEYRHALDWLNTFTAHISILSNAHGTWPMFWPVLHWETDFNAENVWVSTACRLQNLHHAEDGRSRKAQEE